nr:sulfurtransferase-like selenium metabolism protein YedF [Desulfobacterales bacterium]
MTREIDARGLACPAPVLKTKDTIEREHPKIIKVMVDNEASSQNVTRFLESQNYEVSVEQAGSDFCVIGSKGEAVVPEGPAVERSVAEEKKIMVMVATDRMGRGDDVLGAKLMVNFLKTLKEMGSELWRLVFLNNGVKLTVDGSEVLPVLKDLEEEGLHILVCGTCLSHFNLLDKKQVGETTNMLDIVTAMQLADKVINI